MSVWVTSTSSVVEHGVFAIAQNPPLTILPIGTGTAAIVAQFAWGPFQTIYEPTDIGDAIKTYGPPGSDHTVSAYMTLTGKAFPDLRLVRIGGATPVTASASFSDAVPTARVQINAKYPGLLGNQISVTIAAPDDGNALHFNIVAALTAASGTTTDVIHNWNISGTGADSTLTQAQLNSLLLIGVPVKLAAGRPVNGTTSLTSGTSPAALSTDYVGTLGLGDKGIALLEGDSAVRQLCTDDPGNSIRSAVNAGLVAHALEMGDRVAFLFGPTGQTVAAADTDAASYSSIRAVYTDPWIYQADDTTGALHLIGGASFAMSLAAQTSPSTSIAWKAVEQRAKLGGVVSLEANRGQSKTTNTSNGVCTFISERTGGFTLEAAVLTSYPANPSTGRLARTRIGDYIAVSFADAVRVMVDAPNVEVNQDNILGALNSFMSGLKKAQKTDPNHTPHVIDYQIANPSSVNTQASIQSGQFMVPLAVTTSIGMEQIFLSIEFGETVVITAS